MNCLNFSHIVRAWKKAGASLGLALTLSSWASSCASDPLESSVATDTTFEAQKIEAKNAIGARIEMQHQSFYSLSDPSPDTGCAGDARRFYRLIDKNSETGKATPFSTSLYDSTTTIKPAFLRNVSVDLTDANSTASQNLASKCAIPDTAGVAPPSNCASFDYGALGGVSTSLGGTLLLLGGLQSTNYSGSQSSFTQHGFGLSCGPTQPIETLSSSVGYNDCGSSFWALGIETLPASAADNGPNTLVPGLSSASTPISTWAKLSGQAGYVGPRGGTGSSMSYSPGLQRVLLFAGGSPLPGQGSTGYGSDTYETWAFDLKTQQWSLLNSTPIASFAMSSLQDAGSVPTQNLDKNIGGRALFGYASVPAMALKSMTTTGMVTPLPDPNSEIDTTERIVAVGGITANGVSRSSYRFNPTFGPDYHDTYMRSGATLANKPVQWMDSYHTQLMNNATTSDSLFKPNQTAGQTTNEVYAFGLLPMRLNAAGDTTGGFVMSVGGFDAAVSRIAAPFGTTASGGKTYYSRRRNANDAVSSANFIFSPLNLSGAAVTPIEWDNEIADATWPGNVPWYGGASALPGFSLSRNDFVYFGGSSCRDYLTDSTVTGCNFSNPGRYYRPLGDLSISATPDPDDWGATTPPARAGMAAARGRDGGSNIILVAWGGMSAVTVATDPSIYILYNTGTAAAPVPLWMSVTGSGTQPVPLTNAQMVYSHVTGKYYIFGGYQTAGVTKTVSDTWELSVSGACPACTFTWKKLSPTCTPDCPAARRSHRMVEVNYNNTDPTLEPDDATLCTRTAPCSFGIFMEGGTPDGFALQGDRWMFDPTANGGQGHWQRVDAFPPRHLAAMTSLEYDVPGLGSRVHRTLMFGGETGMHSPNSAASTSGYFVPPTLGDTYLYDGDHDRWNRVQLLGKGYDGVPSPTLSSESERRQAYDIGDATQAALMELTPPPVSGGILVTRTHPQALKTATTAVEPLKIPEAYLIGGRLKDGTYMPLSRMYKFCASTTGEKPDSIWIDGADVPSPDDASCDAYDANTNPDSPGPTAEFTGRWLRKTPPAAADPLALGATYQVTPATTKSFQGAAAYDPDHDRIVLFGGITSATAVTDSTLSAGSTIYEYAPATKAALTATAIERNGYWYSIPACTGYTSATAPTGRFGHSMSYDPLNHQLVLVGGMSADGTPLTQTQTYYDGRTYSLPEVWTARRVDSLNDLPPGVDSVAAAPCYHWEQKTVFGNSIDVVTQAPPTTGLSHAASVYVPGSGYNTGYYSLFDDSCALAGPIFSPDPQVSKLMAGGVYFDLDRSELGETENLLLNLTYIPLGPTNQKPDGSTFEENEAAYFKVHLVQTEQTEAALRSALQPRHLEYSNDQQFPRTVHTLSVLSQVAPANGAPRQEQILLPISMDPDIDRVRIERYSGSAILIEASIIRLGVPGSEDSP